MIVISSAKMGNGTFQAKFVPLSINNRVEKIYVLRKEKGPVIDKVEYIVLPKICSNFIFNLLLAPLLLTFYTIKYKADIILTYHLVPHAFFGFFASLITRKPHVFGQTGSECQLLSTKPVLKTVIRLVLKQTKFILTPGPNSKEFWVNNHNINPKKIKLLHSTINTDLFLPSSVKFEYDFIYIGRLHEIKKVDEILNCLIVLKNNNFNFKMCIVGDGEEKESLIRFVNHNNLENNIDFVGFQKNIHSFLIKSKIFVMASIMEGLPVSLMEAMSSEKLVISSNVGNISFLVNHNKNGFLFENGDYKALTNLLLNSFKKYDTLDSIRTKAREAIVENHSYEAVNKKWNQIFYILNK